MIERVKMERKFLILLLNILLFHNNFICAQTSEYGNLKIYTREAYLSSFGYYSGSHKLPTGIAPSRFDYHGIAYTKDYDISNIGNILINNYSEIRFTLDGIFRFGLAMGTAVLSSEGELPFPQNEIKYYEVNMDFFTISLNPEYTIILRDGYAITAHFGIDLINIGGTASIPDKGDLLKYSVGQFNLIPLAFRPAIYFDFGNSGLGIGAYINPSNILSFRYTSEDLYPDDKWGIKTFDNFFKRYEFQIIFTF
ncbi:Hypothetical protein IALB_0967 [Ignavibacterium album JCM 16511]|uniref:Uncharacterized protein n=2 Tax=Ignavibacterium album TaxID=591197 RepID=I0AI72_IGNAJ|nr:Hypothetical protein IALB_0967 [Ignavibacterium album JCM 16511]